eukprot:TRINITY_DN12064_c0_g1_i1.p1 TRINITY_DN12064_c0_g1~~TRINITY_DN12064_c0_g1_i1.p1  ORF type:complete len:138 (+),score=16.15 TRINITY_DN12064_c0_g1_i1:102-515(+)
MGRLRAARGRWRLPGRDVGVELASGRAGAHASGPCRLELELPRFCSTKSRARHGLNGSEVSSLRFRLRRLHRLGFASFYEAWDDCALRADDGGYQVETSAWSWRRDVQERTPAGLADWSWNSHDFARPRVELGMDSS